MINKDKTKRPTSKESLCDFINIYYPIIFYLKSFLHCLYNFKNDLLKLESEKKINQKTITYKIISLLKINDKQLSDDFISLIKSFSENGIDINNIEPNEFRELLLLKMHDENKDKKEKKENELNIQKKNSNKDIENKIRKKNAIEENEEEIKNNKTIISDKFLVTKFDIKKCKQCDDDFNQNYFFKNENFIEIKSDIIEKEKGDIKKIFEVLNNEEKTIKTELCNDCNECVEKKLKTKFYNLSKYLIIFIDKGFKLKENEMQNLDKINFENKEVESFTDEHKYELISMLTENNGNYNYYYKKKGKRFTKNNGEKNSKVETVHSLEEISDNIIILYYCDTKRNDNEKINNNNTDVKTSQNSLNATKQSINTEKQGLNRREIILNNNYIINKIVDKSISNQNS